MRPRNVLGVLGFGLVFCGAAFSSSTAAATLVFGNLGASGTNAIDSGNVAQVGSTVSGSSGNRFAIAFTTGSSSSYLKLQSVAVGLGDIAPFSTAILRIVADNAGSPTGTVLSTQTEVVGTNDLYAFGMGSLSLTANTTYWVTLEAQDASAPSTFSWLRNESEAGPVGLNDGGYTFPASGAKRSVNGGAWNNFSSGAALSISIMAVPEPSTCVLAAAGLGLAGLVRAGRRKTVAV